jgi:hypothetical protein
MAVGALANRRLQPLGHVSNEASPNQAGCMVLAAAVRQDGPMATTVTEGGPRESWMPSATSMRWQGKLATFAECQLNGFANCGAVERVWVGYGFRQGR